MKKSRYTEKQIAFALKQAETGTLWLYNKGGDSPLARRSGRRAATG
ncbi:hypothetical protein GJV78_04035 [Escherichia alba]|jgi:hypothetical protein|uniref:Transposase n=1 Tax=Intestinirhabdus alba TaxID=2899544 RepID=A0A6L6IHM3_9ENTR|nr:hypothetical protein [Intestinirhabdus alba]